MKQSLNRINNLNKNIDIKGYNKLSPMLFALKLIKPNSKVLSIGCGTGREVKYLVNKLNCKVTALDIDKEVIIKSIITEPNAEYHCIDALKFLRYKEFDYVICLWNTINYFKKRERRKLIIQSYYNLKDNGKLIITSGNLFCHYKYILHNLYHLNWYYYFPNQIKYWFSKTGFKYHKTSVGYGDLILGEKINKKYLNTTITN